MFGTTKKLRTDLAAAEARATKFLNQSGIYRERLRRLEDAFPAAKRELVEELLPYVRSTVAHPGNWAAPVYEKTQAEAEIRRLLTRIDEVAPAPDESPDVLARPEQVA